MLSCGSQTRAMIAKIISISTIKNPLESFRLRVFDHALVNVGLTKIAPLGVVTLVTRVFGFPALDHFVRNSNLGGEAPGGF